MRSQKKRSEEPEASRPHMPGYGLLPADQGRGLLPWIWAQKRLEQARRYWLSTVSPDGAPHAMAVWGIWVDDTLYFSTGRRTRKARNVARNPRCAIGVERGIEAVIVEGIVRRVTRRARIRQLSARYKKKYGMGLDPRIGGVYAVEPRVVFAFIENEKDFPGTATRWRFRDSP